MTLKGTISANGISEVLHLASLQQRPGAIHLTNGRNLIILHVKDRQIVGVEQPTRLPKDRLGAMLVAAKLVNAAHVEEAMASMPGKKLGDALAELGMIDRAIVHEMLEVQARETIHQLFGWDRGEYHFETTETTTPANIEPRMMDAVLLDGARWVQLWPTIREKIPSFEQTFERIREPAGVDPDDPAADDLGNLEFEDINPNDEPTAFERLDAKTVRVDRLVQPGRTVQEIIALSRLGTFETCRALSSLITGGYIRLKLSGPPKPSASVSMPQSVLPAKAPLHLSAVYTSVALLLIAFAIAFFAGRPPPAFTFAEYRATVKKENIRRAREIYRLQTGAYPHALGQLVEAGILRPIDVQGMGQPAISQ
jgi:hypothetical protein